MREWETPSTLPDRLIMVIDGLDESDATFMAIEAANLCQMRAPKLSGRSSRNLNPIWGPGWFGVHWEDPYVWFQESGIRPFTMRALAGKTIPMWVDDPIGEEAEKNPKAQTRVTADGRKQTLIFRRAAKHGDTKVVMRGGVPTEVPRSYPGAPGRIALRELPKPYTEPGRVGGRIARYNVGVRWRHPGLPRRSFIRSSLIDIATYNHFPVGSIRDQYGKFR